MDSINKPSIDVDEIIQRIRLEASRQRENSQERPEGGNPAGSDSVDGSSSALASTAPQVVSDASVRFPRFYKGDRIEEKTSYQLNDFLVYQNNETFVKNAYRAVLKRETDPAGLQYYLNLLQNKQRTKVEILGRIRFSSPGRKLRVKINGLMFPLAANLLYRIPVLGYLFKLAHSIVRLPAIIKTIRDFEAATSDRFQSIDRHQDTVTAAVEEKINVILPLLKKFDTAVLQEIHHQLASKAEAVELASLRDELVSKAEAVELASLRDELASKAEAVELANLRDELARKAEAVELTNLRDGLARKADSIELASFKEKLETFLIEDQKRQSERLNLENLLKKNDHVFDAMYVAFEDRFRGTREDIKNRQKVYLPYVKALCGEQISDSSILDVGCGRGEWLELLRDEGYKAKGIDLNRIMIKECQALGLDIIESDVLNFLRMQETESLSLITGFHIVEHLPLKQMIALFDESHRVLKPGGAVIFETPNPENIIVGSYLFYTDPTHKRPLVPATVQFIAEQYGFKEVEIKRLHKYSDFFEIELGDSFKDQFFYNEMDYAIIGYKP